MLIKSARTDLPLNIIRYVQVASPPEERGKNVWHQSICFRLKYQTEEKIYHTFSKSNREFDNYYQNVILGQKSSRLVVDCRIHHIFYISSVLGTLSLYFCIFIK